MTQAATAPAPTTASGTARVTDSPGPGRAPTHPAPTQPVPATQVLPATYSYDFYGVSKH